MTMLFHVRGKNIDSGYLVPPQAIFDTVDAAVVPSFQMLGQMMQQGKVKGGTYPGERGGAFVIEVDSFEELDGILNGLPFFGLVEWEVKALVPFATSAELVQGYTRQGRQMLQGS
jgi:hypothetical protein